VPSTVHIKTKVSIYQNKNKTKSKQNQNKNATESQQNHNKTKQKKSPNLAFDLLCLYVF
jgi:hypothetical protein